MNKKKRWFKRGQITIFLILGLVILFIGIFLFQMTRETRISELEEEKCTNKKKEYDHEGADNTDSF